MRYFILVFCFSSLSCGTLTTEQEEDSSCQSFLEDEDWTGAITCFEDGAYEETPPEDLPAEDHVYLTQWAGAYAGKYGLTGNSIIQSVFETDGGDEEGDEGSSGGFDFKTMAAEQSTAGTIATAIADMQKSVTLLQNIPEKYRNPDSSEALYFANDITTIGAFYALFLFELQKRDFDDSLSDESLSQEEILAKADAVLATLENGGEIVSDPDLQAQIDSKFDELNNQPGDNNAEKLEALLQEEEGTK